MLSNQVYPCHDRLTIRQEVPLRLFVIDGTKFITVGANVKEATLQWNQVKDMGKKQFIGFLELQIMQFPIADFRKWTGSTQKFTVKLTAAATKKKTYTQKFKLLPKQSLLYSSDILSV